MKVTLLFLPPPAFLPVPPLHNPHWIQSAGYLPAYFIHHTWWPYIPYLCWIVLSAAASFVPADIEKEAQAPSVIRCPAVSGFLQGTLGFSFCLLNIICYFLSVASMWVEDVSRDEMAIVFTSTVSFSYPLLFKWWGSIAADPSITPCTQPVWADPLWQTLRTSGHQNYQTPKHCMSIALFSLMWIYLYLDLFSKSFFFK